jgi:hypothetical protein
LGLTLRAAAAGADSLSAIVTVALLALPTA